MRRECYLCRCDLGHVGPDPPGWDRPHEAVTSTLCDRCRPIEEARWRAELTELGLADEGPIIW